jgi:hypothetical protein
VAFVLRTVSRSAEGREIVRSARVEGDRLTIGRDPASGVHLTDLAVALRHAAVQRIGGLLEIRADEGLAVEVDGRKRAAGTIELAAGGEIRIASHLLRFPPGDPAGDDVTVEIGRIEAEPETPADAERLFTLAPVLPGKRGLAWTFLLLILAVGLAWPIKTYFDRRERAETFAKFHADRIWSTGSLSAAHADLGDKCTACHVKPFEAVRDAACKTCHTGIHDHADPFRLARAQPDLTRWQRVELAFKETFDIPPGRCVDCHTEHEGATKMPATAQRFCADCHGGLKAKLPDTALADAGDFGRAHPEFQPVLVAGWQGPRPQLRRVSLARKPLEASNLRFPHALHVSKASGVAQMGRRLGFGEALECSDCHVAEGPRFKPVDMEADCAMCHSLVLGRSGGTLRNLSHGDPARAIAELRAFHTGGGARAPPSMSPFARRRPGAAAEAEARTDFARGSGVNADTAVRGAFSPGGVCWDCHQVVPAARGTLAYGIRPVSFPARYLRKGWFDHRAHEKESCTSCHGAEKSNAAADLLIPGLASCRTCHGGEGSSAKVPSSCAMCHDYHVDPGPPSRSVRKVAARGRGS